MSNESIFYNNKLDDFNFQNLDKKEFDLFTAIISQITNEKKEKQAIISMDFEKLKELSDIGKCNLSEARQKIDLLLIKLGNIAVTLETPENYMFIKVFDVIKWNASTGTLSVSVTDSFRNMMQNN